MGARSTRLANVWVARLMPIILLGVIGFASWVFIYRICTLYLIRSASRTSLAIALITVYCVLLFLLASSYIRVALTVTFNPGYIPRGPAGRHNSVATPPATVGTTENEPEKPPTASSSSPTFSTTTSQAPCGETTALSLPRLPSATSLTDVLRNGPSPEHAPYLHHSSTPHTPTAPRPVGADTFPSNLSLFTAKSIYICESDGYPRWCSHCQIWKPDRAHHCSEVNRCIWRMDHFCPWVGGVVAETSFRYFYQVVVYGLAYCLYTLFAAAVLLGQRGLVQDERTGEAKADGPWIAVICLASLFALFCFGMTYSTTQLIYNNLSTIDAISAGTKVYQLAILDENPQPPQQREPILNTDPTAPIPTPSTPANTRIWHGNRCYVVCKTKPGENPWKQDNLLENFRDAMGGGPVPHWFAWWGVKRPGTLGGVDGFYRWNPSVVERLKREAGIGGTSGIEERKIESTRDGVGGGEG